jgi:hypothetical protein
MNGDLPLFVQSGGVLSGKIASRIAGHLSAMKNSSAVRGTRRMSR